MKTDGVRHWKYSPGEMTEDGKVGAEPAPHGSYDDNTR